MPLKLDDGWNQVVLNLAELTTRAYGTNYAETLRVQIHANVRTLSFFIMTSTIFADLTCGQVRIRRIYFSDRLYPEEELPPEFKLFQPAIVCAFIAVILYYAGRLSLLHRNVRG